MREVETRMWRHRGRALSNCATCSLLYFDLRLKFPFSSSFSSSSQWASFSKQGRGGCRTDISIQPGLLRSRENPLRTVLHFQVEFRRFVRNFYFAGAFYNTLSCGFKGVLSCSLSTTPKLVINSFDILAAVLVQWC